MEYSLGKLDWGRGKGEDEELEVWTYDDMRCEVYLARK